MKTAASAAETGLSRIDMTPRLGYSHCSVPKPLHATSRPFLADSSSDMGR